VAKKNKPRGNPVKIQAFQFKPGQSGNPKGRPRKQPLADLLAEVLSEKIPQDQEGKQRTLGEVLVRNWVLEAIKTRDNDTVAEIFNRMDGKVKDRIALGGDEGEPIRIETIDMKNLSDEELEQYEQLVRKGRTPRPDRRTPRSDQ
jgi:hypothetical protein